MESPSLRWKRPATPYERQPPQTKCKFGGNHKGLCAREDCDFCFERSLASIPEALSMFVLTSSADTPRKLSVTSHRLATFECPDCSHKWTCQIYNYSLGSRCPFCITRGGRVKLCDDLTCQPCFERSLASSKMARSFVCLVGGTSIARSVPLFSNKRGRWKCDDHGEWVADVHNVVLGNGCPNCKNQTEGLLKAWLTSAIDGVTPQWRKQWCRMQLTLPFDFHVPLTVPPRRKLSLLGQALMRR